MYKEYPYLLDGYYQSMNSQLTKKEFLKKIDELVVNHQYVKITLLDVNENPIKDITGEITGGSLNISGDSTARKTSSLTCSLTTDIQALDSSSEELEPIEQLKQYFSIDKKIFLEIGIRNDIDEKPWTAEEYPILWFPQGIFFITDFSISSAANSPISLSIGLKDKMCKLNGFSGGKFPAITKLDTYYDYGEANAVAEEMSRKSIVKGAQDEYIMNTKISDNGTKTSDISWIRESWNTETEDYLFLQNKSGEAVAKFTVNSNKYLQFEYATTGDNKSIISYELKRDSEIIKDVKDTQVTGQGEYKLSEYDRLTYKREVLYLDAGTYTLTFDYTFNTDETDDEVSEDDEKYSAYAAIHMLNSNLDGGMTFIQQHNGKNPVYNIISEIVHHFGEEDLSKIIVEDVPVYAKTLIKWDPSDSNYSGQDLYMISNIRNNDPILDIGNRIVNVANDANPNIPGTNYGKRYDITEDEGLSETEKQPDYASDNLMLVTADDMKKIEMYKWALSLIGKSKNMLVANAAGKETIEDLNDSYAEYVYAGHATIDDYMAYILNAGTFGSKSIVYSSFGGMKYNIDINVIYTEWEGSLSSILKDLDHSNNTCYIDKNGYLFSLSDADAAIYFYKFKDEDYSLYGEYSVERYQTNDDIGYTQSYLYYDGDLTASPGDTVTSILDKIVEYLGGNYEFYYDTFGSFHFREKRNYLQKSFSTAIIKDTETANNFLSDSGIYYLTDTYQGENVYTFSDKNNITSINNNPNYSNIKNDYIIQNKSGDDMVFYHIAIDEKPEINKDGYDNVLVYKDPTADSIPGVRSEQYQLAFPIFIDSPNGPQGSGSANIYGYVNNEGEIKLKLNEINWNKDYSKTINISSAPATEEEEQENTSENPSTDVDPDDEILNDIEPIYAYEDNAEFFFHLTFLNLLFATGGDSKKQYTSNPAITSDKIAACLYYLYNKTDNANNFYYIKHSTSTKTIVTNEGKKNEKKYNVYKSDLAYKHLLGLSYNKNYIDFTGFENAKYASIFDAGSYRFKNFESSYLALGKNNYQRAQKVTQLIQEIVYDSYLYDAAASGTWNANGASSQDSFITLYTDCMNGLSSLYGCAEEAYNKKSNGKHNASDKYYNNNLKKYLTGYIGGTDPKINYGSKNSILEAKEAYRKQLKKENKKRKKKGKKVRSKKTINRLVEKYYQKLLSISNKPRFKDKRTKNYASIINALYRTLKKIYTLTKANKTVNAVKLDGKYYYSNKSVSERTKNKKLLTQLLKCFWNQDTSIKSNDKNKNAKFKKFMNQNSKRGYKYIANWIAKNINIISQPITLIRYKEKTDVVNTSSDVIAKAREHKGCCESPSGSDNVKDVASHGGYIAQGYPWCAAFVRHVFKECGMLSKITYSGNGYSNLHCFYYQFGPNFRKKNSGYKPQPGDLVLYDWGGNGYSDHIGIVIKDKGNTLQTIEGNTNGGKVWEYSNHSKDSVIGYVENNLVKKTSSINKASYTEVTYTLFSLFRKTFFYELNNVEYNNKKPVRCNNLRQKLRTYYEILYNKVFCAKMKDIYAQCAASGEGAKEKKNSNVSQTPATETPSDIQIDTATEDEAVVQISININYLSGKSWIEWAASSYNNTTPRVSIANLPNSSTLMNKYVVIFTNNTTYWLGNDNAQIINAESDIVSGTNYTWYDIAEVQPTEEALITSGISAPNLEYTTYNCIYKGLETVKFWYYDTVSSSWKELEDWVCYYNADENKRYYNIDFTETSTDTYTGIITPKYLPNLQFMKSNGNLNKDTNELTYTYSINPPSMRINSSWYKDTSFNSKSPLKLDNCEYDINSDDNRTNLSKYIAREWRTELILQGLLSYEQNSIAASYYYPELKANWPTTYNLKNQCFYGQEEENDLYHTSLTTGNYFLDLIEPNETQMGNLSVSNIGRRQLVTVSDSVNCLFKPEPHDYYFINSAAIDYFEQRDRIHNEGGIWITVSPELWENCFFVGSTKVDAYNIIRSQMTEGTNYQNVISISSIPVLYLDPNIRISVEDSSTNTYGDYIINSFSIDFSGTPTMTTNATKAIVQY